MSDFSIISIVSLALVDAVNPCALAVIAIVLMTVLLSNPKEKRKALWSGLAFSLAVYILYFLYGLIMVQFFSNVIPETGSYSFYIFRAFGLFAIILGLLNIKDFLFYEPGTVGTEMPLSLRPKMKRLVKKINSPRGAFVVGIFVTLFLLPCTIGPYIIASGKLSVLNFFSTVLWLLLYNIIFILPMVGITFIIYLGLLSVDKFSDWRKQNIRYLHLIEGSILIIIGILMVSGLI